MAYVKWTDPECEALAEMVGQFSWPEIAEKMKARGFPERHPEKYRDAARKSKRVRAFMYGTESAPPDWVKANYQYQHNERMGTVQANRPRSADEMAELFDIDTDSYVAEKVVTNQWARFWQTKVWWRLNLLGSVASEKWDEILDLIRVKAPEVPKPKARRSGVLYIIEITDAHLGMLSWGPETGADWDLNLALAEYRKAFYKLLMDCPPDVECILIRIGDDLFHYDKMDGGKVPATFKGTPQDVDSRWPKLYSEVAKLIVGCLEEAARTCPNVWVLMIQGNHDKQTVYSLGDLLQARFHNDERFQFDNDPKPFKTVRWGVNLFGFTHGSGTKKQFEEFPETLKQIARSDWGETLYAEVHSGDKHHEFAEDKKMVVNRKLRALCPNDLWHTEEQYDSYRGAQAFTVLKDSPGVDAIHFYTSPLQQGMNARDRGPKLKEV